MTEPLTRATDDPARSKRLGRIRSLSRTMAVLCTATSAVLAAAVLLYWIVTPTGTVLAQAGLAGVAPAEIGFVVRALAFGISMVPLGVLIWGLLNARRCFDAFARGHIFSRETVGGLKAFSIAVAASALLKPFVGAALSLLLSWGEPSGRMTLAFGIGSDALLALVFAGTVAVIAWVLTEAIAISDENAQFI